MLTKTDKSWIGNKFATKEDLSVARIDLKTEMAKMEDRIEVEAQKRHNELLVLFDGLAEEVKDNDKFRLVTNHRMDKLEGLTLVLRLR